MTTRRRCWSTMANGMRGNKAKALAIFLVAFVVVSVDAKRQQASAYAMKDSQTGGSNTSQSGSQSESSTDSESSISDVWSGKGLKKNYYKKSCSSAESLVTAAVTAAYANDPSIVAGLIRLFFHDCFVRGCDASVLLDGADTEKQGAPNLNSLRGFEVIDAAKASIEAVCPGVVSCADIVSYAGRDSIVLAGGYDPKLWPGGRKDGSTSISAETLTNLPAPFFTYSQLVTAFANKGLTEYEMIVLSSAHTVGRAHCGIILARLYNYQGTGLPDPAIDPTYLQTLQGECPRTAPGNIVNMDLLTPTELDINYDKDVLAHKGFFESDNALQTVSYGQTTLNDLEVPGVFGPAFIIAMLKMSTIEVLTKDKGKIRTNCRIA